MEEAGEPRVAPAPCLLMPSFLLPTVLAVSFPRNPLNSPSVFDSHMHAYRNDDSERQQCP